MERWYLAWEMVSSMDKWYLGEAHMGAIICPKGVASTSRGRLVMWAGMPLPVRNIACYRA